MDSTEKILQTMSSWHWGELIVKCSRQGLGGSSRSSPHNYHKGRAAIRHYANQVVVAAFNQEKALKGAFSMIVQLHQLIIYSTNGDWRSERWVCTAAGRDRVLQLLLTARTRHESTEKRDYITASYVRLDCLGCPLVDEKSNCLHVGLILSQNTVSDHW